MSFSINGINNNDNVSNDRFVMADPFKGFDVRHTSFVIAIIILNISAIGTTLDRLKKNKDDNDTTQGVKDDVTAVQQALNAIMHNIDGCLGSTGTPNNYGSFSLDGKSMFEILYGDKPSANSYIDGAGKHYYGNGLIYYYNKLYNGVKENYTDPKTKIQSVKRTKSDYKKIQEMQAKDAKKGEKPHDEILKTLSGLQDEFKKIDASGIKTPEAGTGPVWSGGKNFDDILKNIGDTLPVSNKAPDETDIEKNKIGKHDPKAPVADRQKDGWKGAEAGVDQLAKNFWTAKHTNPAPSGNDTPGTDWLSVGYTDVDTTGSALNSLSGSFVSEAQECATQENTFDQTAQQTIKTASEATANFVNNQKPS